MKKFLFLFTAVCLIGFASCDLFKNNKETKAEPKVMSETVEQVVAADMQEMTAEFKADTNYVWFSTVVTMKNYLDSDDASDEIVEITDVFQVVKDEDGSLEPYVYMFTHVGDDMQKQVIHDFWMEDCPMTKKDVAVTFADAYQKLMAANCVKPHSRKCVLRKPIGPYACNPQYIFGNTRAQVYVDATDGTVRLENPAFTKPEVKK